MTSSGDFIELFRHHPAGVAIVTAAAPGMVGFTASSVISVCVDPPALAFSLAATSSAWPTIERARTAVVHFLAHDQIELSARFATRGIDRFESVAVERLPTGEPLLLDVAAWTRVRLTQRIAVANAHLVVGEALEVHDGDAAAGRPPAPRLVYVNHGYRRGPTPEPPPEPGT